jgi:hypothetical protein
MEAVDLHRKDHPLLYPNYPWASGKCERGSQRNYFKMTPRWSQPEVICLHGPYFGCRASLAVLP